MNKLKIAHTAKSILNRQSGIMPIRKLSNSNSEFETLKVTTPYEHVYHVQINRPEKRNAMNPTFFKEIAECFKQLSLNSECRSIVLSAIGKGFTAGLDLSELSSVVGAEYEDPGRKGFHIKKIIDDWQGSMSAPENCHKPVIASLHGFCVGGGVDLISSCDIRYCTKDSWFTIKEVDIGLAADIGTLQRFPKIIGNDSFARELIYTARKFTAAEAEKLGFVSKILPDEETCLTESLELAKLIASKSPVAVQGSKINLIFSRDHSVSTGLRHMNSWNMSMIQSEDTMKAAMASLAKEPPIFSKL